MREEIIRLIETGDTYAAVQRVQREAAPYDIAGRFDVLVRELYWKSKHLRAVVAVARGGIAYCLTKMDEVADERERSFFADQAKKLAFNLASFTWPGWDEAGVAPTANDVAVGLDAAKLNLRLAGELNKDAERVEDAHWLLGAHLLAACDAGGALAEFQQCSPEKRPLFAGYALLARIMLHEKDAQSQFDALLVQMRSQDDDEQRFNSSQLATAHRVFAQSA